MTVLDTVIAGNDGGLRGGGIFNLGNMDVNDTFLLDNMAASGDSLFAAAGSRATLRGGLSQSDAGTMGEDIAGPGRVTRQS